MAVKRNTVPRGMTRRQFRAQRARQREKLAQAKAVQRDALAVGYAIHRRWAGLADLSDLFPEKHADEAHPA